MPNYLNTGKTNVLDTLTVQGALEAKAGVTAVSAIVKAMPSQTADLQQWQDSAGAINAYITPAGAAKFGSGSGGVRLTGGQPSALQWGDGTGWQFVIGNPAQPHMRFTDNVGIEFLKALNVTIGSTVATFTNGTGSSAPMVVVKQGHPTNTSDYLQFVWSDNVVRAKVTVAGDFDFMATGRGPIIVSPNGTRYRVTVDDAGALSSVAA